MGVLHLISYKNNIPDVIIQDIDMKSIINIPSNYHH